MAFAKLDEYRVYCACTHLTGAVPAMKNGRCRMHGGKAGRKPIHRLYTKRALDARKERVEANAQIRVLQLLIERGYGPRLEAAINAGVSPDEAAIKVVSETITARMQGSGR